MPLEKQGSSGIIDRRLKAKNKDSDKEDQYGDIELSSRSYRRHTERGAGWQCAHARYEQLKQGQNIGCGKGQEDGLPITLHVREAAQQWKPLERWMTLRCPAQPQNQQLDSRTISNLDRTSDELESGFSKTCSGLRQENTVMIHGLPFSA